MPLPRQACNVFRLDPSTGALTVVADDLVMPNGLAFSPAESILYIADSGWLTEQGAPHYIRTFEMTSATLADSRVLAEISPGIPDGFRLDVAGNLWVSAWDGVHCITPAGVLIGKIKVPEMVANVAFGGPRNNRLFITATTGLYSIFLNTAGLRYPFMK